MKREIFNSVYIEKCYYTSTPERYSLNINEKLRKKVTTMTFGSILELLITYFVGMCKFFKSIFNVKLSFIEREPDENSDESYSLIKERCSYRYIK